MFARRKLLAAALAAPLIGKANAQTAIALFAGDARPLANADGPRRGIVLDVVLEAARIAGRALDIRFLPFADAMTRTRETPGALMAPLARNAQREADFAWIAKVVDVPQAMGTRAERPTVDLAGARALGKIGVARGGVQEAYLREQGFANLVVFATGREIATALAGGEIDAWYAVATQIANEFEAMGRPDGVRIGPTLQVAPAWLAANRDTGNIPVAALADAIARMERDGAIERIYRSYVRV
jgi:polar amino acid transport system substrate-binding protein